MSLAITLSRAQVGTSAPEVTVEVHIARGLPRFRIVGLPETAVKESADRVRGAILNSGFEFPNQRISVNLAPADLPKEGGRFDLAIAVGLLAASSQIPLDALNNKVFLGELALSGTVREVRGSLLAALSVKDSADSLVLPMCCVHQAVLVDGVTLHGVSTLNELAAVLNDQQSFEPIDPIHRSYPDAPDHQPDMSEVIGQDFAKYAMEIAASGGHSIFMIGPPGTGKTMLASRLPGILPPMSDSEALETAAIASLTDDRWQPRQWKKRPFRAPHHSSSGVSLIGGGTIPRPGEISRAHNGVLFLDELTEFDRRSLELLREPIESGYINIARASMQVRFKADFMFAAAANPCPCGYLGDPSGKCQCSPERVRRYLGKISGPLLDRMDIQLHVARIPHRDLRRREPGQSSNDLIRSRVCASRDRQIHRQGKLNSELSIPEIERFCPLEDSGYALLDRVIEQFSMSARAYHRILKLSRTVADSKGASQIADEHLSTAIRMRCMDRSEFTV